MTVKSRTLPRKGQKELSSPSGRCLDVVFGADGYTELIHATSPTTAISFGGVCVRVSALLCIDACFRALTRVNTFF